MTQMYLSIASLAYTLVAMRRPAGLPIMVVESLPETRKWFRVKVGRLDKYGLSRSVLLTHMTSLKSLTEQLSGPCTIYMTAPKDRYRDDTYDVVVYVKEENDAVILKAITADYFRSHPLANFTAIVENV